MEKTKMDYTKTKIYKIMSYNGDLVYVGSTTKNTLAERMAEHRKNYKTWKSGKGNKTMSFELFEKYGVENCSIVLLELCPCNSKDEKNAKEAHHIQTNKCVNRMMPGRTMTQYTEDYREKINAKNIAYYHENKDSINKLKKETKFKCECGSCVRLSDKTQHNRTNKHNEFLKRNN